MADKPCASVRANQIGTDSNTANGFEAIQPVYDLVSLFFQDSRASSECEGLSLRFTFCSLLLHLSHGLFRNIVDVVVHGLNLGL